MKYKVIHAFADLKDRNHKYETGDQFPRPGFKVSEERLAELMSNKNKIGVPLIKEIPEPKKPTEKKPTENKKGKKKNAD